jgi:hypothetical protein
LCSRDNYLLQVRILKGLWVRLSEPCASKKLAACSEWRIPEWEELGHTPIVFVRVANNELTAYGTWKSAESIDSRPLTSAHFAGQNAKRKECVSH